MKLKKKGLAAILAAALIAISGCGHVVGDTPESILDTVVTDASESSSDENETASETSAAETTTEEPTTVETVTEAVTEPSAETVTEAATQAVSDIVTTTVTTKAHSPAGSTSTVVTTTKKAQTSVPNIQSNTEFKFTESYNKFLSETVFVGDSICSGLRVYGVLPADNVVAKGSVSANNIFTFNFSLNGKEVPVIDALKQLKPKYVVFSMGMNDINMTTSDGYIQNYKKLLTEAQKALPDSKLIVASITPISSSSKFSSNSRIDSYNSAVKAYLESSGKWYYTDVSSELKDSSNSLKKEYNGGDGIHLSKAAYYAILYQVCQDAVDGGIYNS